MQQFNDCSISGKSYVLLIQNALYVPSMSNNLIAPFIMREAGIDVSDIAKIHVKEPNVENHSIHFPETGFRIPLSLTGTFSYFHTSKPSLDFLLHNDEVYVLTPPNFDPHNEVYAKNEADMLDWEGNMIQPQHRRQL